MRFKVTSNINIPKRMKAVQNDRLWIFAAYEWWRLYSPFCPMRTGALYETVRISPKQIHHRVPYAKPVYERNRNYRKDLHPLATSRWDIAAIPTQKRKLIRAMQKYIDSGRLEL